MAKRTKSGYRSDEADDDVGEDSTHKAAARTGHFGSASGEAYEVVEPGTVIDGVYYPKPVSEDTNEADTMIVNLSADQAQALADSGVKLTKDGEPVEPSEKEPEPEPEDEQDQGHEPAA